MESKQIFELFLIRHGQSQHNLNMLQITQQQRDEEDKKFLELKFSNKYTDASITDLGQQQALKANEQIKDQDIKIVIVSPLKRAIQTCNIIFKNHKNFQNIKFIVHPMFREMCLSSCDIGDSIEDLQNQYSYMDFSEMDKIFKENKKLWVLDESCQHSDTAQQVKQNILQNNQNLNENGVKLFLEQITNLYPNQIENAENLVKRTRKQRQQIIEIKEKYQIQNKQLAIVGHGCNFKFLISDLFTQDNEPVNGKKLENCEIYKFGLKI